MSIRPGAIISLSLMLCGVVSGAGLSWPVPQAGTQPPATGHDVFALVRALDEAASRGLWPGFDPAAVPLALFDGEHTILLRHPSPPPEFSPAPGRLGVLIAPGRYPAVVGNSTREIGGTRTATVIAAPGASAERTLLALVEEVFHVFWLGRHPTFRPNEMARYAYPLDNVKNLEGLLAEDEALARALDGRSGADAARWAAAALAIRQARVAALAGDVREYETSLEMMEGTANFVARSAAGEPAARTAERLRVHRPADDIRWRYYDSGAALCFLLDRLSPDWKARSERVPALTTVELLEGALGAGAAGPAAFSPAESSLLLARASADIADLGQRRQRLRTDLGDRPGGRIVIDVDAGAEPLSVRRFDPINLMVLDAGAIAHANYLTLAAPGGTVDLTNPTFARGTFGGTVSLSEAAGRHPLSDGIRRLTIVGIQGAPKAGRDGGTVTVEAPGVRITLRGADVRVDGDLIRIAVKGTRP